MAKELAALLAGLPLSPARDFTLRRFVGRTDLSRFAPPNYLFTSGYPGRYNPDRVLALYAAEDAATAGEEWERRAKKSRLNLEQVLYTIEFSGAVADLGDSATCAALGLDAAA